MARQFELSLQAIAGDVRELIYGKNLPVIDEAQQPPPKPQRKRSRAAK